MSFSLQFTQLHLPGDVLVQSLVQCSLSTLARWLSPLSQPHKVDYHMLFFRLRGIWLLKVEESHCLPSGQVLV